VGVSWVSQFNDVFEIYRRLTLVAMVTKNVGISYNLAYTVDTAKILTPELVFQVSKFKAYL